MWDFLLSHYDTIAAFVGGHLNAWYTLPAAGRLVKAGWTKVKAAKAAL